MSGVAAQLAKEYPDMNARIGATVVPFLDQILGSLKNALGILSAAVLFVLLITSANVAGLLLIKAASRRREMAVRAAPGANGVQLLRIGVTESVLISACGGSLGLLIGIWILPALRGLVPRVLNGWARPEMDLRLFAFALLISTVSSVLFGAMPALSMSRVELSRLLEGGTRGVTFRRGGLRRILVIGEVALAMVLTIGAGLMVKTVWALMHVDLGFQPDGVLTLRTSLPLSPESPYRSFTARNEFYSRVLERVRAIPGVVSAGYTTYLPLTNRGGVSGIEVEGAPPRNPAAVNVNANLRVVSQEYLQTIGVRLLAGRFFQDTDGQDAPPVAVINQAMAAGFWSGQNPLGKRFRLPRFGAAAPWIIIVGVVDNVRQTGIDLPGRPEMYFASTQSVASSGYAAPRDLAIRVKGDPLQYAAAAREAIWSVDRNQPISDVQPLREIVDHELTVQRTSYGSWRLSRPWRCCWR